MEFLCAAKEKKRSCRVFVAEGAPGFVQVAVANMFYKAKTFLLSCFNFDILPVTVFFPLLGVNLGIKGIFLQKNWSQEVYRPH